jgi:ribosomal protein S7
MDRIDTFNGAEEKEEEQKDYESSPIVKEAKPLNVVKMAEVSVQDSMADSAVMKKKDDTHRMAEANKAFSHFRF